MTPMAAECAHNKCSSYFIGYFETTNIGMTITKQIVLILTCIFIKEVGSQYRKLLINGLPATILKCWLLKMAKVQKGISIDWFEFYTNFQYLHTIICLESDKAQ